MVHTQRINAVAECQQTAVDVCALDHPLAAVLRVRRPLRPSQVDQKQLAYTHLYNKHKQTTQSEAAPRESV